jgi:hypothetical protein
MFNVPDAAQESAGAMYEAGTGGKQRTGIRAQKSEFEAGRIVLIKI